MNMKKFLFRKIHPFVSYPILAALSFSIVAFALFFYMRTPSFAQVLLPFEGRVTNVDYVSCVCGLSMLLTIEPINPAQRGDQPQQMLFFYGGTVLSGLPIPTPRLFSNFMIFTPGSQKLLGNFLPVPVPCVAYTGTACTVTNYYPPILNVGTSFQ